MEFLPLCTVIPSLLIPLSSPYKLIRERALDCLRALQDSCSSLHPAPSAEEEATPTSGVPPSLQLVQQLTRCWEEICSDHTHIVGLLRKLAVSCPLVPPPPPTPTRRKSKRLGAAAGSECSPSPSAGVGGGWLECVLMHVVSLGMPVFVQHQFLSVLREVDHIVSQLAVWMFTLCVCCLSDEGSVSASSDQHSCGQCRQKG